MKKILFILKKRGGYGPQPYAYSFSSGLYNSALFVVDMINDSLEGKAALIEVEDNNEIDKHVTELKPDIVVIEALWVVPEKFEVLHALHPGVEWIIRLHSDTPFLASEGMAIDWLFKYCRYANVRIAANSQYAVSAFTGLLGVEVMYLPNYYPVTTAEPYLLHIGCFGAVRPMKNHLTQAIAAIRYADETGRTLHFHINASRVEEGDNHLKNLRALFANVPHSMVEHPWMPHNKFIALVKTMDIGLQVSLSETYNIVAADFVNQNVPIVVSREIEFVCRAAQVINTKDVGEIVAKLQYVEQHSYSITRLNKNLLRMKSQHAVTDWQASLNQPA